VIEVSIAIEKAKQNNRPSFIEVKSIIAMVRKTKVKVRSTAPFGAAET
jgi:transketolase